MENKLSCNNCDKTYSRRECLRRHQISCGADKRPTKFCSCGAKFFRSDHLQQHQKRCPKLEVLELREQAANEKEHENIKEDETLSNVTHQIESSGDQENLPPTQDAATQTELTSDKMDEIQLFWNKLCSDAEKEMSHWLLNHSEFFL